MHEFILKFCPAILSMLGVVFYLLDLGLDMLMDVYKIEKVPR